MSIRSLIPITISAVLLAALVACGPQAKLEPAQEDPQAEPAESTAIPSDTDLQAGPAARSITFRDDLDQEVALQVPAQRIVSLAPSVTETLFAIGAGGQVIGRTDYCNYPEEVLDLPSIGGFSATSISIEAIIALEPDLVIGGSVYQAEVIQALEQAGIPAFVNQPDSLAGIVDTMALFGQVTAHEDEAQAAIAEFQASIEAVEQAVAGIPAEERPTIFYEVWHEPLMSANGETVVGELIEIAGGANIFAELPDEYPTVSVEQIVADDPDFIIGPSSHGDQMTAEVIGAREGWESLSAVSNQAIFIVDGDIVSHASPRIIVVLEEFARILHPDLFQ